MSKRIVCAFTPAEAEALLKHLSWATTATNDTTLFDVQCKIEQAVDRKPLEWSKPEDRQGGVGWWYRQTTAVFCGYELKITEGEGEGRWIWFFGEDSGFCCVDGHRRYDRLEDAKADAEAAVRMVVALFGKATK